MSALNLITDAYDRQARLYPGILVVAPVLVSVIATFSPLLTGFQTTSASILGLGGAFLLSQLARDAGKRREAALCEAWGGSPSVAIFRHRDTHLSALTKSRYHGKMTALVKEREAPSVAHELANPAAADEIYSIWSNYLRVNTRDTKVFPLLFKENINYGYRRNVLGLRPLGTASSLCGLAVCGLYIYSSHGSPRTLDAPVIGAAALSAFLLVLWLFRFNDNWVKVPADAYAARLAECCETLRPEAPATTDLGT